MTSFLPYSSFLIMATRRIQKSFKISVQLQMVYINSSFYPCMNNNSRQNRIQVHHECQARIYNIQKKKKKKPEPYNYDFNSFVCCGPLVPFDCGPPFCPFCESFLS